MKNLFPNWIAINVSATYNLHHVVYVIEDVSYQNPIDLLLIFDTRVDYKNIEGGVYDESENLKF